MNISPDAINQIVNQLPYPIGKDQLVQAAKQRGVPEPITNKLDQLPNQTYNSPQDLQNAIGKLGMGNIKP